MKALTNIILTGVCLLLLTACTAVTDGSDNTTVQPTVNNSFINLTIAVTNSDMPATRGTPAGGENGDGREAGFERENAIVGITLILYKADNGINTTSNPAIDFVAYYPVSRTTKDADTRIEATYTTGNRLVPHNTIDFTKTYRAIVVANADLTGSITAGTSHLNDLRNMTLTNVYSGSPTSMATTCGAFVMSSEQDQTLAFAGNGTQDAAGDYYYDMSDSPLLIERMAARIDFWAVNGTYNSEKQGYVYPVGETSDQFVVLGLMPFNLTNGHATYGTEYLLKRLTASLSTITPQWLVDETTSNYVLDPQTTEKVTATTPKLTNALDDVKGLTTQALFEASSYYKSVAAMHAAVQVTGNSAGYQSLTDLTPAKSGEDVIVAYPMENTLLPESYLYYHATGIALLGAYYRAGESEPVVKMYYGFLRHHGEGDSYDIETTNDTQELSHTGTAMNVGIVRNNIYRIWIGSITPDIVAPKVTLKIKVKKWDQFTHDVIYM